MEVIFIFSIIISVVFLVISNVGFLIYHLYLRREKENNSRLLNVLFGDFAMNLQCTGVLVFCKLLAQIHHQSQLCIVHKIWRLLAANQFLSFGFICLATVLRVRNPTLYLEASIKWIYWRYLLMNLALAASINLFVEYNCGFDWSCSEESKTCEQSILGPMII